MIFILVFTLSLLIYSKPGVYSFTLPPGEHVIECYGAQGGKSFYNGEESGGKPGGKGAFVNGTLVITGETKKFYAHVGGEGGYGEKGPNSGGINGGGKGGEDTGKPLDGNDAPGGGGGASDIRYRDDFLYNRIMVAAGGSGAAWACQGAPGGDINGYKMTSNNVYGKNSNVNQNSDRITGVGEDGEDGGGIPSSGAGGGWRGGIKGETLGKFANEDESYKAVASSGSSYIAGHNKCSKYGEIEFKSTKMTIGVKEHNGTIKITSVFNCSSNCVACSSSTKCTQCKNNYLLRDGACYLSCISGYIKVGNKCQKCSFPCKTCSTSVSKCLSCNDSYVLVGTECKTECPVGFYKVGKKCSKCDDTCKSCEYKSTNCTECSENYTLYNNECIAKCPEGYIKTELNECTQCDSTCKTCFPTSIDCTSCKENLFLHEGKCINPCPLGFFGENGHCSDCKAPCETCDSKDVCLTCVEGFHLSDGKCVFGWKISLW